MKFPKIPEKAVPLIILLAVVIAVFVFTSSSDSNQSDRSSNPGLAVSGSGVTDPGDAVVEAMSGYDEEIDQALDAEEKALERKVADALSKIAGVGKVDVTITFHSGVSRRYATHDTTTERETQATDSQGGSQSVKERTSNSQMVVSGNGLVITEVQRAQIAGVLIVAEGADNSQIATGIRNSVKTLLGIDAAMVSVAPMAK